MSVTFGTSSKNYSIGTGSRVAWVASDGTLGVLAINTTDSAVEMWISANNGDSWSLSDNSNAPQPPNSGDKPKAIACCIDSSDIVRVLMWWNNSANTLPRGLYYTTYDASATNWDGGNYLAKNPSVAGTIPTYPSIACAISNGNLQVAFCDMRTVRSVTTPHIFYTYYNGSSWSTAIDALANSAYPDLIIDRTTDKPIVTALTTINLAPAALSTLLGDAANATSFTTKTLGNLKFSAIQINQPQAIQDAIGNIYILYMYSDGVTLGTPTVTKHLIGDSWATWGTPINVDDTIECNYATFGCEGYGKFNRNKNIIYQKAIGVDPAYDLLWINDFNKFNG